VTGHDLASVEALVFDLGGVLVEVDIRRALRHWAATAGVPAEAVSSRWKQDEAYWAHERGQLDDRAYFAHLRTSLGLRIDEADMLAGWNAVLGEPLPGIEPIVRSLAAQFPLYVFSNTNPAHIAHFTPRYARLLGLFRKTITSCEIGARKPEAEAFLRLAKLIGAQPQRLLFFDDLEENVLGARRAGLQAFRVGRPEDVSRVLQNRSAR
jgi:putative hydrolase of the HAD superfamily